MYNVHSPVITGKFPLRILFLFLSLAVSGAIAQKSPVLHYGGETQRFVKVGNVVTFYGNFEITDLDNTTLKSAIVRLESGYRPGDRFAYSGPTTDGIVVTDGRHGTITLAGEASLQAYVTALGSVAFSSVSPGKIVISFRVSDGLNQSNLVRVEVNVIRPSNYPPSFVMDKDALREFQIWEDEGPKSKKVIRSFSPGPVEEKDQKVSFVVDSRERSLFARVPIIDSTGLLMVDPGKDAFGTATVVVYAKDNGGNANSETDHSAEQTFTLVLKPVNDAPAFTKGADITVGENSGPFEQEVWAKDIITGPVNEAGQTVNFELTGYKAALFSMPPSIDATGKLTFMPAPNVWGETQVKVVATDNGGVEHHGVDRSEPQTFLITIREVNAIPQLRVPNVSITYYEDAKPVSLFPALTIEDDDQIQSARILYLDSGVTISSDKKRNTFNRTKSASGNMIDLHGNGTPERYEASLKALTYETSVPGPHQHPVTLQLTDDRGSLSNLVTVMVNVVPVNDAPAFVKGPDIKIANTGGRKFFKHWATKISAGAKDEAGQSLAFVATGYNKKLFATEPKIDAQGNLTLIPMQGVRDSTTVQLMLRDNGGIAHDGVDSSAVQTFTIRIVPENQPPVVKVSNGSFIYYEGFAPTPLLPFVHIADDGRLKHLNIHYEDSLVTLSLDSKKAKSAIRWTVHPNERMLELDGLATSEAYEELLHTITYSSAAKTSRFHAITLEAIDEEDHASNVEYITVMVVAINDPPIFTIGQNTSALEDAGQQSIPGWASQITPGLDEVGQKVSFSLLYYDTALFAGAPIIDSTGNFRFMPAPNVHGSTRFYVVATDNGGTANGGKDQSDMQTFSFQLNSVNDAPSMLAPQPSTLVAGRQHTILLSELSAGPGEENQILTIDATSGDRSLLSDPMVIYDGNREAGLVVTTDTLHTGSTTLTITLRDNGGTENGGKNETVFTLPVTVVPPTHTVFVPERFSPGRDGQNNFQIKGFGVASLQLRILSYDGNVVFETEDLTVATRQGWDGTWNGQELPPGSYTWLLQGKFQDGSNVACDGRQYGQVLLVR